MTESKKFTLINGVFNEEDANNLLYSFFSAKIKLHAERKLSTYEREGIDCEYSNKRIAELTADRKQILELMQQARLQGKTLKISSEINIELVDEEPTLQAGKLVESSLV